jgi:DNA end-binding protein Ku
LKQPLFCPHCNRQVERSEVVKGYEYEPGQYVVVTDEEIKKITPSSSKTMETLAFVKQEQIDPIYFDSSFLVMPDKDSEKAYALLLKTLGGQRARCDRDSDDASAGVHRFYSAEESWADFAHDVFCE